jgi:hypothetical protein
MLRNKEEIENYEEKAKLLKENGWTDHWHEDNWVKTEWFNSKNNIDRMGLSTDRAYQTIKLHGGNYIEARKMKVDLINYEGGVLQAQDIKKSNKVRIFDQWGKFVVDLDEDGMEAFIEGRMILVDSKGNEWNYTKAHPDAQTPREKIMTIFE